MYMKTVVNIIFIFRFILINKRVIKNNCIAQIGD